MVLFVNILVLTMLLSGIYFGFRTPNRPCSFGYKGLSFYYFGRRVWKFSNRVFGGLLIVGSLLFFAVHNIWDQNVTPTDSLHHLYLMSGYLLVSFILTDACTFMKKLLTSHKHKKNNAKQH